MPLEDARLSAGLGITSGEGRLHEVDTATGRLDPLPIDPTADICPGSEATTAGL